MKRVTRDFSTLFNMLWYRDFPLTKGHKQTGSRAEWTTHIGICTRTAADLMGYFTYFEHGNRTDAVIKDNDKRIIANLEWEWAEPRKEKVNEIQQLYDSRETTQFSAFISYSDNRNYDANMNAVINQWSNAAEPLLFILIRYNKQGSNRVFDLMETHHVHNGRVKKIRSQPALPWEALGKRWQA